VESHIDFDAITRHYRSIEDAIGGAFQESKLLVVMVHSELSEDSVRLFQDVLDAKDEEACSLLSHAVHTFVISVFSEVHSQIPAAAVCAAPAILVFAPVGGVHGMAHLGTLEGPVSLHDVKVFVQQAIVRWNRSRPLGRQVL
jgi:hypothetical protein